MMTQCSGPNIQPRESREVPTINSLLKAFLAGKDCLAPGGKTASSLGSGISALVVIGSSGSGKTTIVNMMKYALSGSSREICVPKRLITRPLRENDDFEENMHVGRPEFGALTARNVVSLGWRRRISARRSEQYGFLRPDGNKVALYSANNAICSLAGRMPNAMVIGVHATKQVRIERLVSRSPRILSDYEEAHHRLEEPEEFVFQHSHLVINNNRYGLDIVRCDFLALIEWVTSYNGRRKSAARRLLIP
jgi:ribose 1,5-bisphosphokinase PhnN